MWFCLNYTPLAVRRARFLPHATRVAHSSLNNAVRNLFETVHQRTIARFVELLLCGLVFDG
jgi:heme oxygenase